MCVCVSLDRHTTKYVRTYVCLCVVWCTYTNLLCLVAPPHPHPSSSCCSDWVLRFLMKSVAMCSLQMGRPFYLNWGLSVQATPESPQRVKCVWKKCKTQLSSPYLQEERRFVTNGDLWSPFPFRYHLCYILIELCTLYITITVYLHLTSNFEFLTFSLCHFSAHLLNWYTPYHECTHHTHTHTHTHTCAHACMHARTCTHTCTHTCMQTCTHTHTPTQTDTVRTSYSMACSGCRPVSSWIRL